MKNCLLYTSTCIMCVIKAVFNNCCAHRCVNNKWKTFHIDVWNIYLSTTTNRFSLLVVKTIGNGNWNISGKFSMKRRSKCFAGCQRPLDSFKSFFLLPRPNSYLVKTLVRLLALSVYLNSKYTSSEITLTIIIIII